jgi:hypothetical protein
LEIFDIIPTPNQGFCWRMNIACIQVHKPAMNLLQVGMQEQSTKGVELELLLVFLGQLLPILPRFPVRDHEGLRVEVVGAVDLDADPAVDPVIPGSLTPTFCKSPAVFDHHTIDRLLILLFERVKLIFEFLQFFGQACNLTLDKILR